MVLVLSPIATGTPKRRVTDLEEESVRVAQARLEGRQDTHEAICTERHAQNLTQHESTKSEIATMRALLHRIGWGVMVAACSGVIAMTRLAFPRIFQAMGLAP